MPYQRTILDRVGPDGGRYLQLIGPAFLMLSFVTFVLRLAGVRLFYAFLIGLGAAALGVFFVTQLSEATGEGFLSFLQPSGSSTPYEKQYSLQESLAIRGDIAGAISSYEAIIAGDPADVEARIRAAELHATKGANPKRAAECFLEARRVPGLTPARDLYISNRLIDLLRGPLKDEGRAMVELRRLIQLHPTSRDAQFARDAIAKMKMESVKDARDDRM
jgi:hypothetical protein